MSWIRARQGGLRPGPGFSVGQRRPGPGYPGALSAADVRHPGTGVDVAGVDAAPSRPALAVLRVGADAALSTIDLRSTDATAGAFPSGTGRAVGPGSGAAGAAPAAPVADPDDDALVREALRLRADASLDRVVGHVRSIATDT